MTRPRHRVLFVCSHVIQYLAPLFRQIAQHPGLDFLVAYCSLQGAVKGLDPEFCVEVAWDVPLLEGYSWVQIPNGGTRPRLGSFFGLFSPGLWTLIRRGKFDAVYVGGYAYLSYWVAILAAKFSGSCLILTTDANTLASRSGKRWKMPIKKVLVKRIFGLADVLIAPASGTVNLFRSLGFTPEQIFLCPFAVDNEYFQRRAEAASRDEIRQSWNVPSKALVVLCCAKLQPWKRPADLLRAFAQAAVPNSYLIFAGEGPLRATLEEEARGLRIFERVRFLGFVNQSRLPGVYVASDLLCLPSEHEPTGFVVDEAMVCGLPAVVSDRVGARYDLIDGRGNGFVYPMGHVEALAAILREVLPDRERLKQMGWAARQRMETWSFREHVQGLAEAVDKAVRLRAAKD